MKEEGLKLVWVNNSDSIDGHWIRGILPCRKHANESGVKKGLEWNKVCGHWNMIDDE
jgi:hypothetical protein